LRHPRPSLTPNTRAGPWLLTPAPVPDRQKVAIFTTCGERRNLLDWERGESAGWPRASMTGSRNVRTPQGTVLGNAQSGRPAGQRNREQTAAGAVRHADREGARWTGRV